MRTRSAEIRAFDLFCGAGGSSWGAASAGAEIVGGIDIDDVAVSVFQDNFRQAKWVRAKPAEEVDLSQLSSAVGDIDLLIASPDCTSHTHARGARPPDNASRDTALQVVRFARALDPKWIVLENVVNMKRWEHYRRLHKDLDGLGYKVREQTLDAADFGVPQSRRRLFLLCEKGVAPEPVCTPSTRRETANSIIEMDGYPMTPLETARRAPATIERADRAVSQLGTDMPFLVVYYGSDKAGGWQRIDTPLRTVTTIDRFALVKWEHGKRAMRMLQVPELERAMGFDSQLAGRNFQLRRGSRRQRVRLLGNAVCPPVMEQIVRHLAAAGE